MTGIDTLVVPWSTLWQPTLTFATLCFLMLPSQRLARRWQFALLFELGALSLIPINGIALAIYLRSVIDDLAITTVLVLSLATLVRLKLLAVPPRLQQTELLCIFAALALILYPASLGLTYFDPYRLGYAPRPMLVLMGLLTVVLLWRRKADPAICSVGVRKWLPSNVAIHRSFAVMSGAVNTASRCMASSPTGAAPLPRNSLSPFCRCRFRAESSS